MCGRRSFKICQKTIAVWWGAQTPTKTRPQRGFTHSPRGLTNGNDGNSGSPPFVGKDGTPWQPTKHSKICSRHFVNGEKSNDPRSPAYLPTLFPKVYGSTKVPTAHRYERLRSREQHEEPVSSCASPIPGDQEWGGAMEEHTSVGTQTDPCTWFSPADTPSIFLCYLKEGQAETQAVLPPKKKARMHRGEHPTVSRTLHVTL